MNIVRAVALCLLALATAEAASWRGIEYRRIGGVRLRMDARTPDGAGPFPAAILVHGGAWVAGSRRFSVKPLFGPLQSAGFAWFSISYRMARKAPLHGSLIAAAKIGDAVEDVQQAVNFVRSHAAEFHVDANRVVLIGESAGAQLASMAAIRGAEVKAVVAFYCPSDLVAIAKPSGLFSGAAARVTWGGISERDLHELSPIAAIRGDMPPFLFIHGTADHVVPFDQSLRMCDAMKRAGASCQVIPVKGGLHGMSLWETFRKTDYKPKMTDWLIAIAR